jgi:uncharacterized membrane protein YccC
MHGANIASAIASVAASITDALLAGRPTAELRRELAALEQRQRSEAAEAAAAEREARAVTEAEEQARQQAAVAGLVAEAEARVRQRLSALEPPVAPKIRRSPAGISIADTIGELDG